jgi:hypothetical protein
VSLESDKVSLKEYVERIFSERQNALDLAFKAQQEALGLASRTLELRLEKLNELRQEVTQDRGNYLTKAEFESKREVQDQRLGRLENFNARILGFGAALALIGGILGGILGQKIGI